LKPKPAKDTYTFADLQNWSKATRGINPAIRLAVVGDPVAHSLSAEMQNAALRECGIEMQYTRLHVSGEELEEALELLRTNEFIGLNLTIPHKERAVTLADRLDDEARQVGAINTMVMRDRELIGFNTDGVGFSRAIREEFFVDLRDLRVLVLGAGGAARAVAFECGRQHCERLVIANRSRANAERLVHDLQSLFIGPKLLGPVARLQAIGWDEWELRAQIGHTDLIVNATPLGLQRSDRSPVGGHLLAPHLMVFDTVYGSGRTALLTAATEAGARGANGLSMLLHQGAAAFELWFGREAPIAAMRNALHMQ
jgi:shikimate dehydrogenase